MSAIPLARLATRQEASADAGAAPRTGILQPSLHKPRPRPYPSRTAFPAISVVVPVRNEARNLEIVLPAIARVRPSVHEIIVVDGHSTDDSIEATRAVLPSARVVTESRRGKGNAMACGF
ncbi:MAG: glycosyl transferase, partial [Pseudonocardia sp.]|nr:glycosyl transferase [Pseudonocardia sp.]